MIFIYILKKVSKSFNLFNDYYMNRSYAIAIGSLPFSILIVIFSHFEIQNKWEIFEGKDHIVKALIIDSIFKIINITSLFAQLIICFQTICFYLFSYKVDKIIRT